MYLGDAARDAVELDQFAAPDLLREEIPVEPKGNLLHANLRGAPPVEGAAIGEHLAFHERDERAAQDDHHVALGKHRVPDALEDGGGRRVRLAEVLELVQRDDEALAVARQTVEENVPVVYGHLAEQLVARERGHLFLEGRAVLFLRLLRRQEVQRALVADELGDERRLPDAAPAVDDRHGRLVVGELLLQGGEFFSAIDERVHNCPFLSHASLEGYYTSKYYTSKYNLMHVQLTQGLLALFFTFRIIFRERRRCARMRGCVCVRSASSG